MATFGVIQYWKESTSTGEHYWIWRFDTLRETATMVYDSTGQYHKESARLRVTNVNMTPQGYAKGMAAHKLERMEEDEVVIEMI